MKPIWRMASVRRRRRNRLFRWILVVSFLAALGVAAYVVGSDLARQEVADLRETNRELTERLAEQSQRGNRLRALAEAAQKSERDWRRRYAEEVPSSATKELVIQIQNHLAGGADPNRIALFVDAGARPPICDGAATTKRFLVRTPLYAGANDSVSFANSALTVTAIGQSATDADGNPEAWFDPAKPLTLRIVAIGGELTESAGPLPLHHAVVWGGAEYRFSVVNGDSRGFVYVTADRCAISGGP